MLEHITEIIHIRSLSLKDFSRVSMTPSTRDWWTDVPAKPGWYAIETNTPFSAFKTTPAPSESGKRYNLAPRIGNARLLIERNIAISPKEAGESYIVYSGEHSNLKSRAREHTHGDKDTGCLCLSQYAELCAFQWTFLYLPLENHVPGCVDDKLLRTYLEQKWRCENGWPVLCSK